MTKNIKIKNITKLPEKVIRVDVLMDCNSFGSITIKGIRVLQSPKYENIWVQLPSYSAYGKYYPIIFFEDPKIWDEIQESLRDVYREQDFSDYIDIAEVSGKIDINQDLDS